MKLPFNFLLKRHLMKLLAAIASIFATLLLPSAAMAYDATADVKIVQIEVTYMPDHVVFWVDRQVGACPTSTWLDWSPQNTTQTAKDQNAQAVLAALMTAKVTGASMRVFIENAGCKVKYIYLL
jgi:hypothetical protein